ncbi:MAG: hypothetical protein GF350_12620 [Chitinivibrionales bacterium]|nr:hypothetical protein [Chitinivibrionales bacterium]
MNSPAIKTVDKTMRNWDSRSQGPRLGNLIFMKLIAAGGTAPAYVLLRVVALWYALTDTQNGAWLTEYHRRIGVKTGFRSLYRHFLRFGESLIDGYAFLYCKKSPFGFSFVGEQHISGALDRGKGVLLLSAHVGNWEIAGNMLVDRKIVSRVNFIMLDKEREEMRDVFKAAIEKRRVTVIPVADNPLDMMVATRNALKNNEIVCIDGDRVSGNEQFREMIFLGKKAKFPAGPFVFSAITGAPILAVFCVKDRPGHYLMKVFGSITVEKTSRAHRDTAIHTAMQEYINILESFVRQYPFAWFNIFEFWES